jgi:GntR family transcriptional regulator
MLLRLSGENPEPLYRQISDQIRRLILTGELAPGAPLPSIRELAQQLTASIITVRRAYWELEREGLITTRQGLGTFVARLAPEALRRAARTLAAESLRRALAEVRGLGLTDAEIGEIFCQLLKGGNGPT